MTVDKRIYYQEVKDRWLATQILKNDVFSHGKDVRITATNFVDHVDLKGSVVNMNGKKIHFNVEVKERFKNAINYVRYPNAELKQWKLNYLLRNTPSDTKLLYMVMVNEKECYVYQLDKIDFGSLETFTWIIRNCQLDKTSDYSANLTYKLPFNMAVKKVDCSKYYKQWEEYMKKSNQSHIYI